MKEEIKAWLQGPRVYLEGVALFEKYGFNKVLKNVFSKGSSEYNLEMLVYELSTLAGISEQEAKAMTRTAKVPGKVIEFVPVPVDKPKTYVDDLLLQLAVSFGVTVDALFTEGFTPETEFTDAQKEALTAMAPAYAEVPETMKKVIRIREVYPFLKDVDCPTEIKLMVHDMFSAYDGYRDAYAALDPKNSQDENLLLAATVVERYLDNRAMWEELDYYKEHTEILGKHPIFEKINLQKEIAAFTDLDLMKNLNNAKSNVTKSNKALAKAVTEEEKTEATERLTKWETRKAALEVELTGRKK